MKGIFTMLNYSDLKTPKGTRIEFHFLSRTMFIAFSNSTLSDIIEELLENNEVRSLDDGKGPIHLIVGETASVDIMGDIEYKKRKLDEIPINDLYQKARDEAEKKDPYFQSLEGQELGKFINRLTHKKE